MTQSSKYLLKQNNATEMIDIKNADVLNVLNATRLRTARPVIRTSSCPG